MIFDILKLDTPSLNGRIYPHDAMVKAIEEYNEKLTKKALIEVRSGAPEDYDYKINLSDVAFMYDKLYIEDNIVKVNAIPMNTPKYEVLDRYCNARMSSIDIIVEVYPIMLGVVGNDKVVSDISFIGLYISSSQFEVAEK